MIIESVIFPIVGMELVSADVLRTWKRPNIQNNNLRCVECRVTPVFPPETTSIHVLMEKINCTYLFWRDLVSKRDSQWHFYKDITNGFKILQCVIITVFLMLCDYAPTSHLFYIDFKYLRTKHAIWLGNSKGKTGN